MVDEVFGRLRREILNPDDISLDTYREMLEDSSVASSLKVIINMTIGRSFEINGGEEEHRDFLKIMFGNLNMDQVFERVLSGVWVGFSVAEKVFHQQQDGKWVIRKYKILPPETISFEMKKNGEILSVIQFGSVLAFNRIVRFSPPKVNVFTYDNGLSTNFSNPYGNSALRAAYKDWFSKDWIIAEKNRWIELNAGGLTVGNAASGDPMVLYNQLKKQRSSSFLITRGKDTVEFKTPANNGKAFIDNLLYHDKRIREALIVPTLLIGQEGQFGSAALSQTQFELFERARIERLQKMLTEWVAKDIKQIIDINFGPQDEYPRFTFKLASDSEKLMRAQITKTLVQAGVTGQGHQEHWARFNEMPSDDPAEQYVLPNRVQQPETTDGSSSDNSSQQLEVVEPARLPFDDDDDEEKKANDQYNNY